MKYYKYMYPYMDIQDQETFCACLVAMMNRYDCQTKLLPYLVADGKYFVQFLLV